MRCQRPLVFLASALVLVTRVAIAQRPQIDQSRQRDALNLDLTHPSSLLDSPSFESVSGEDLESFGVQQLLRENEPLKPFHVYADFSFYATSNVALTRRDELSDQYFLPSLGFDYRRPLPHGFQFETSFRWSAYRYNRFPQLDFNSIDVGAGLIYHSDKLGGIDLFGRYNFNELISRPADDVFFTNHTITFGTQKIFSFSQAHYAYIGATGQISFADPTSAERSELAGYAGYHAQLTRNLEADLLYRYARYLYTQNDREDNNHTISLGVRFHVTDWLSASASSYMVWNRSDHDVFSYDSANAGVGLTLHVAF